MGLTNPLFGKKHLSLDTNPGSSHDPVATVLCTPPTPDKINPLPPWVTNPADMLKTCKTFLLFSQSTFQPSLSFEHS